MLGQQVERLLRETAPSEHAAVLAELELSALLVAEAEGGAGLGFSAAGELWALLGQHASPATLGEQMVAAYCVGDGLDATIAAGGSFDADTGTLAGHVANVPWSPQPRRLLLVSSTVDVELDLSGLVAEPMQTMAGTQVARLDVAGAHAQPLGHGKLKAAAVLLRSCQMAGALAGALALTTDQVQQRQQFGRALAAFQAVQQQLSLLAMEAAAVEAATRAACRAVDAREGDVLAANEEIMQAKLRANLAVPVATAIAHQLHGAIGFTAEHGLRQFTQRLWQWRSEFGSDTDLSGALGHTIAQRGGAGFWAHLTARDDVSSAASLKDIT